MRGGRTDPCPAPLYLWYPLKVSVGSRDSASASERAACSRPAMVRVTAFISAALFF